MRGGSGTLFAGPCRRGVKRLALVPVDHDSGGVAATSPGTQDGQTAALPLWGKLLDQTRCIGCHACTTACKSENEVPVGVTRTFVKSVDIGTFPTARRAFQVTRCNQCQDARRHLVQDPGN